MSQNQGEPAATTLPVEDEPSLRSFRLLEIHSSIQEPLHGLLGLRAGGRSSKRLPPNLTLGSTPREPSIRCSRIGSARSPLRFLWSLVHEVIVSSPARASASLPLSRCRAKRSWLASAMTIENWALVFEASRIRDSRVSPRETPLSRRFVPRPIRLTANGRRFGRWPPSASDCSPESCMGPTRTSVIPSRRANRLLESTQRLARRLSLTSMRDDCPDRDDFHQSSHPRSTRFRFADSLRFHGAIREMVPSTRRIVRPAISN